MTSIDPRSCSSDELVPQTLRNGVVTREAYANGNAYLTLSAEGEQLWDRGWARSGTADVRAPDLGPARAAGLAWLARVLPGRVLRDRRVGLGNVTDAVRAAAALEPARLERRLHLAGDQGRRAGRRTRGTSSCARSSTSSRGGDLAGDRLPGRLVRGAARRPLRGLILVLLVAAVLDQLPDADVRLDEPARLGRLRGATADALSFDALLRALGLMDGGDWLGGQHITVIMALVYGYVPYLILPLFASLDRIDQRLIEAARDLGAPPVGAFWRVVVPLAKTGMLAGIVLIALPMFGDYYTPDLISGSPRTACSATRSTATCRAARTSRSAPRSRCCWRAFLLVFMLYYLRDLRATSGRRSRDRRRRRPRRRRRASRARALRNPWGKPRFLASRPALHRLVARAGAAGDPLRVQRGPLAHVAAGLVAALVLEDPNLSVFNDPTLQAALRASLELAAIVDGDRDAARHGARARAAALAGAAATGVANTLLLLPLVTPELVFAVGMFLLFTTAFGFIGLGTTAQAIGQVTFTLSWVVLIVRARLATIGRDVEEAAADLGAPPYDVVRRVLLPLLAPAIAASLLVAFALSIDDFVVASTWPRGADTTTVPMRIYAQARGAPTPALNALATMMLVVSLLALVLAYLVFRCLTRGAEAARRVEPLASWRRAQ